MLIDRAGGIHSLARRLDGLNAAQLGKFMAPIDRESLPGADAARALILAKREAKEEALIEKGYAHGDDYVSQATAAQKDFERRQEELNQENKRDSTWDRIERAEKRRADEEARKASEVADAPEASDSLASDAPAFGNLEMTDEMQAKLDQLLGSSIGPPSRTGPPRQPGASGRGRTRSR